MLKRTAHPQSRSSSSRPLNTYAAWLVDLDGTLYHAGPVRVAMAFQLLFAGPRTVRIIRRFRQMQEHMRKESEPVDESENPYQSQVRRTAQALGREPASIQTVVEYWMIDSPCRWLRRFRRQSLINAIGDFRKRGGLVALVSDYPAKRKLLGMGLTELFDVVVANGEQSPRRLKPAPDGLLMCADLMEVSPRECLMIGDRPAVDGEAARRAGMDYILPHCVSRG